jgi:hypothetical protein
MAKMMRHLYFTSLNVNSFMYLLQEFSNHYVHRNATIKGDRPRRVPDNHYMLLCFYIDKMSYKTLSVMFGVPVSTLSRYLNDTEVALLNH